jgi:hypothetical protein
MHAAWFWGDMHRMQTHGVSPQLDNTVRLHRSLGYRPAAPEAVLVTSHRNQISI